MYDGKLDSTRWDGDETHLLDYGCYLVVSLPRDINEADQQERLAAKRFGSNGPKQHRPPAGSSLFSCIFELRDTQRAVLMIQHACLQATRMAGGVDIALLS